MRLYYCVLKPLLLVESGRGVGGAEKPIGAVIPDSSTLRVFITRCQLQRLAQRLGTVASISNNVSSST